MKFIFQIKEHYLKIAKNRPGPRDFSVRQSKLLIFV